MNSRITLFAVGVALLSVVTFAGTYGGGLGTETNPYRISTAGNWLEMANTSGDWDCWFILTNNINLSGVTLTPVGNDVVRFTGVFDGNRYIVQNATINKPTQDFVGVFGYVGSVGEIKNLGVVNVTIYGYEAVGALVGRNHGIIFSCYASGSVSGGNWDVGGLAGSNIGGLIEGCYAAVNVTSTSDYVGGLVGYNLGDSILDSYALGAVNGVNYIGGLVGANDKGQVVNCYSIGKPSGTSGVVGFAGANWSGIISGCFWDTQTSGTTVNGSATGKTTAEMKTLALYTNVGWDFDTVWSICQNSGYPRLQWQILEGDIVCPDGVGMEDAALFSRYWLRSNCGDCGGADLNGNGAVTISDLLLFSDQWLGGR